MTLVWNMIFARISLCEQEIRNDMTQIRNESELNRRGAEKRR